MNQSLTKKDAIDQLVHEMASRHPRWDERPDVDEAADWIERAFNAGCAYAASAPVTASAPARFLEQLETVRQIHRVMSDLEESVDDLVCGLSSLHDDDDLWGAGILLRTFQRRQGEESTP